MYVAAEGRSALVIDPHISEEAREYLLKNSVEDITVLLTHEHYDHVSGTTWLKTHFDCTVVCHKETEISLRSGKNNRPVVIIAKLLKEHDRDYIKNVLQDLPSGFVCSAEKTFVERLSFDWYGHMITMISTAGHSKGSCCIEIDGSIIATGDSLIPDTPVITSFPGGNAEEFERCAVPYLGSIKQGTYILPGHGEPFIFKGESLS